MAKSKNVLIFVQSRLEKYGGYEEYLVDIAKSMPSFGMKGFFVFPECKTKAVKNEIESYGSEVHVRREVWNSWRFVLKSICNKMFRKADILHFHFWLGRELIVLLLIAKLFQKKIFIQYQEDLVAVHKYHRFISRYKLLSLFADKVITASNERREAIRNYFNIRNSVTIHYGITLEKIDAAYMNKSNRKIIILCVASITRRKGIKYLIQAVPLVINEFSDVEFHLVGSGKGEKSYYKDECAQLVKDLGIGQYVKFFGIVNNVYAMMHQSDIFVLPSLDESFGIVLAEAMAARKPIVSTKVGSVGEVVSDGETGILVPPSNPNALAQAILSLLRDRKMMKELGTAGRKRVENMFLLQDLVNKLLKLYSE